MSRTDKDRPAHVRIRDPYENTIEQHYHIPSAYRDGACSLPDFDDAVDLVNNRWGTSCYRTLPWWSDSPYSHAPAWLCRDTFDKPERTRARNTLRDAAKDYNANGELDDFDYWNRQHRHNGAWLWW